MTPDFPKSEEFVFKLAFIAAELGVSERNLRRKLKSQKLQLPKWGGLMFISKAHAGMLWNRLFLGAS